MSLSFLAHFLYSQFFITPPPQTKDCTGKTVVVTGANGGLGKEATRRFVALNCEKVILACRSIEKGEAAKKEIEASTGRQGVIEVWQLDLESYESVKEFAKRAEGLKRLDVLLENAGISTFKFKSVGGNESSITVNVVSTFMLALLLTPKLQETGRKFNILPNLTIVSSEVHFVTPFKERSDPSIFTTLNTESTAKMDERYWTSKLLEVFACRQIAQDHPADKLGYILNFVNPGFCHSELTREMDNIGVAIFKKLLCRTTEVGSRTLVHASLQGPETHGKYMSNARVEECSPLVEGPEGPQTQRKVWDELQQKLEEIQPGITKVLDGAK